MNVEKITELLGKDSEYLLGFKTPKVNKDQLHIPGPDWIERIFVPSDRPNPMLRNMQLLFNTSPTKFITCVPITLKTGSRHNKRVAGTDIFSEDS